MVLEELKIKFRWKGRSIKEKCYDENGKSIIECDPSYYRPLEVNTLLGDSSKARKKLKWKPKINVKTLVKEMVFEELKKLQND